MTILELLPKATDLVFEIGGAPVTQWLVNEATNCELGRDSLVTYLRFLVLLKPSSILQSRLRRSHRAHLAEGPGCSADDTTHLS